MALEKILQCMHDVCNKLGVISLSAKLMQKKCDKCPKRAECGGCPNLPLLASVVESCTSIASLINSHRRDGHALENSTALRVNVFDQLKDNGRLYQEVMRLGQETGLKVSIVNQLPDTTFISLGIDVETEGMQFLNNVFFNARKANATAIRIVIVDSDDHIIFRFIDDGDGMSPDTLACLGLSIASKTSTGEGTRIIKKIVHKSNEIVEWSSAGKGAGCCVTLRFLKYFGIK